MLLYIIRHGDPHYPTDSLTPRGVLQAEAVGKRLAAAGITKIYSSPMGRAKQTAYTILCARFSFVIKKKQAGIACLLFNPVNEWEYHYAPA